MTRTTDQPSKLLLGFLLFLLTFEVAYVACLGTLAMLDFISGLETSLLGFRSVSEQSEPRKFLRKRTTLKRGFAYRRRRPTRPIRGV